MKMSLDTETTGKDFYHGTKVFFVTTCQDDGTQSYWEWEVNPVTRQPRIPDHDVLEIQGLIGDAEEIVLQNGKFDYAALHTTDPRFLKYWNWDKVHDTLVAGHVLYTNLPHDLTSMALQYLHHDITPVEVKLEEVCQAARRLVRSKLPDWRIAKAGLEDIPSAKETVWKYDTWLPRAVCLYARSDAARNVADASGKKVKFSWAEYASPKHPWWTALSKYANADSEVTMALWLEQQEHLHRRGLWKNYLNRRKVALSVASKMEMRGVTASGENLDALCDEYTQDSEKAGRVCVNIAARYGHELVLPKNGVNQSLRTFMFDHLKLEKMRSPKSKTDAPTLNKVAMETYLKTLDPKSWEHMFVKTLVAKRQMDTAVSYMSGYKKFWVPWLPILGWADHSNESGWYVLHPSFNPTGTNTLRWSSSNPNAQNISKKENFNLRYCFGPAPGREWWSLDAQNIELRIPAYESGEEAFIALFERPNDPPYFGSNHLLISHLLHPKEFEACVNDKGQMDGRIFKKKYAATLYQRTKNGNFAVQYGAVDREDGMGTADRTYGIPGAQARIKAKFVKQEALNQKWIKFAEKCGYVETMPSTFIDPERGFPIMCTRTEYGRIKPTVPLNYHVQGTAMQWTETAMIRCDEFLEELNRKAKKTLYWMTIQVHDELVFDFPRKAHPKSDPKNSNLAVIKEIQRLMSLGGDDIGVPTPVSCEYHADNWSVGEAV